jgi:transcriptional regulator with XRE-family HTH domain
MLTLRKYRVLELMDKAGYRTQEEFANDVGVSRTWMSALLNGRATPTSDQLVRMARLLGQPIEDIVDYPKAGSLVGAAV